MDWNSKTPSEWDWENLAMFSGKTIEIPKRVSSHEIDGEGVENGSIYSSACVGFSGLDLGCRSSSKSSISASVDSSLKEGAKILSTVDCLPKDYCQKEEVSVVDTNGRNFSTFGGPVSCGEPMIGLKLGKRTYFEDICTASTSKNTSFAVIPASSTTTAKRSRASYHSTQTPRCQVEGCNLDLKSAKDYHRRHRICESHSKSPRVIVAGMERRFCQQCSRFHNLSEFDDNKRSCRRRLFDHNARRRRPQPEANQFNSARASSIYDGRQQMNLLLNRVPMPVSHHKWENACNFKITQSRDSLSRPAKIAGIDRRQPHLSSDELPNSISMLRLDSERILSFQSTTPQILNRDLAPSAFRNDLDAAPDLHRALSLLSTNSWGLNEPEPILLDQFIQMNQSSVAQPVMHAGPQNPALASSQYMRVEQPPAMSRVHSLDLHSNGSSQFQEFEFKAPYESGCFYSNQIN